MDQLNKRFLDRANSDFASSNGDQDRQHARPYWRWPLGLNVVSGWSEHEFEMMGIEVIPHRERYQRTEVYVEILKGLWTSPPGPFSHSSKWYDITDRWISPLPIRQPHPPIANADVSKMRGEECGNAWYVRHDERRLSATVPIQFMHTQPPPAVEIQAPTESED